MQFIQSIFVFVIIGAVAALDLPSGMTACKQADTKCLETAFTQFVKVFGKGSKEYGIPKIDPLLMQKIHIPGNGGPIDLEQTYENTNLVGLSNLVPKAITATISDSKCAIDVNVFTDDLKLLGSYTANGKMLVLPVNGGGSSNLTLKDPTLHFHLDCEMYDKGGEKHLKIKKFNMEFVEAKIILDYKNLVNNNAELSQTVLNAMNENSQDMFNFLKPGYEAVFSDVFKSMASSLFEKVPLEKLFLD